MAHPEQEAFFAIVIGIFSETFRGKILDVGSLDINGGPRHLMQSCAEYVGVDLGPGPNVDLVSRGEDVAFPDNHFDVTMSSECFEHNPDWARTLRNMIRMTRPSGLVIFSCATSGREEHGTTRSDGGESAPLAVGLGQEHYGNVSRRDVAKVLRKEPAMHFWMLVNREHADLLFLGMKAPLSQQDSIRLEEAKALTKSLVCKRRTLRQVFRQMAVVTFGYRGLATYRSIARRLNRSSL